MNKTLMRILGARAELFAEFASTLRERLRERNCAPSDDSIIAIAAQLYEIEDDESEVYPDDDDGDDDEEETDW